MTIKSIYRKYSSQGKGRQVLPDGTRTNFKGTRKIKIFFLGTFLIINKNVKTL